MSTPTDQRLGAETRNQDQRLTARLLSAPLWIHAIALGFVLLVGLAMTVPGHAYFSDEGAAILQERQLRAGEGWIYDYPFAEADPEGNMRPFINGQESEDGVAPYAKHPLFVFALGAADAGLGTAGLVLFAVSGTVFAAVAAGLIGRLIDQRLAVPSLWVTGIASPLFFDSYLVLAHTVAAASAAFAVLLSLRILRTRNPAVWTQVLLAAAVASTMLLRSEGLAMVPALVVAAVVIWRLEADKRSQATRIALIAVATGMIAFLGERAYIATIVGDATEGARIGTENWLVGRFTGFYRTWFPPTYQYTTTVDVLVGIVPLLLAVAAVRTRKTHKPGPLLVGFVAAAALWLARFALAPASPVPGLVAAFPIAWAGLWMLSRRHFTTTVMRFTGVVAGTLVIAVLMTQVSRGAGVEWGGRYFAFAIAIITPVVLRPWLDVEWDRRINRLALALAVALCALALAGIGLDTLRVTHILHRDSGDTIDAAMANHPPGGQSIDGNAAPATEPGVVVISQRLGPQILWPSFREYDWLAPTPEKIDLAGEILDEAGRTNAAVMRTRGGWKEPEWDGWVAVDAIPVNRDVPVFSMERP